MRRHGWALCLGAVLAGSAAAQPPAGEERFPPAPDLPGEVVGQLPGAKPAVPTADPKDAKAAPLPAEVLTPKGTTPVTPVEPAPVGVPVAPAPCPPAAGCPAPASRPGCSIGFRDIKEWLLFRSQSRQSGHFITPYRPPLIAWFPCEPRPIPHGPACAGCPAGVPVPGGMAPGPTGPLPLPAPAAPVSEDPPLAGGLPVGKCLDAEVLTTFQPVAPGVGFTPGVAPMANPTTQVKPTSFKPK